MSKSNILKRFSWNRISSPAASIQQLRQETKKGNKKSTQEKIILEEVKFPSKEIIDNILPDELLVLIFSYLLPENLHHTCKVNKKWNILAENDFVWRPFCSVHWDKENSSWKKVYLEWLRRMAYRLQETQAQNQKMLDRYKAMQDKGKNNIFIPINFFWPSFTSLKERYTLRVLVVGDQKVGKTSLLHRFTEDNFSAVHLKSELTLRSIDLHDRVIELQILDSGYENFRGSKASCYLQAHICLVCYDISDLSSFQNVKKWFKQIRKHNSNIICYLVGTKSDSVKRSVQLETAKALADELSVGVIETSAKESENVTECFVNCAKQAFKALAWPNYVPPEKTFRQMVRLPEVDWCVKKGH